MAKKTPEQIQAKKEETARIVEAFKEMPIDKWAAYIKKNAPKGKENRQYRACAKKALSVANMKEYITQHDNTAEAKANFKAGSYGIQYEKQDKKFVLDEDGNKIPLLDENGNPLKKQSVVYAVEYFTTHYLDGLLVLEENNAKAFDLIKDW